MALAWLVGTAPGFAGAQSLPGVKDLLALAPSQKKGVEFETPAEAAAIDACKVETVYNAQKRPIGVVLRDGQGKLLRKFIDSNGNGVMDQWSFYQDGFEVYRESDLNNDKSPDECRWMNSAGTRIGALSGGRVTAWKRISAEEASKVFVQALVAADLPLLETVLASPEELDKLGIPKGEIEQVTVTSKKRAEQVNALIKGLVGWNTQTVWNRLDGTMPHLIPAEAVSGLSQDLVLYENAVIFAGLANGQGSAIDLAFLQAPEMIKIGEVWKFVELPRAVDPKKPLVAVEGGIRAWLFKGEKSPGESSEMEAALKALARYDDANAKLPAGGDKREVAQFHVGRIPLIDKVVKVAPNAEEQLNYNKQIVDSLGAAIQTGYYQGGLKVIDKMVEQGGKLGSYAAFRKIAAEFALRNDEPGANLMANQKTWMTDLKTFLDAHGQSEEAPDALLQLASAYEFNAEEDDARKYYTQLNQSFPNTEPGKKAAGALRRLELVGKSLSLKGPGVRNEPIDVTQLKGKSVLVVFWATWAEPVKRDLPELIKVYQKYRAGGFEIVGVSLDNDRADLDQFLKENPLPWPQIFEPGGMESRLSTEFGIISLPTMILVDAQGKVVNRNIRTAAELDRQLEKSVSNKPPGVALEDK
jgi:thiol-disulfide isomerase/thioredoxin